MESVAERMARFAQRHREDIAMYKAAGVGIEEVSILGAEMLAQATSHAPPASDSTGPSG